MRSSLHIVMSEESTIRKAHCNQCSGERDHRVLFELCEHWTEEVSGDPRDDVGGDDLYEILKCAGCGHIVFRHTVTDSRALDDRGDLIPVVTYSPPKQIRKKISLLSTVAGGLQFVMKDTISELLDEIYIALHSECERLAAMGIRALLEHIFIDQVGDHGRFQKNLDAFETKGFMSKSERVIVETALEVGHASIHRNHKPQMDVLLSCLDITESLINRIYLWPKQANSIRKTIPPRS